MEVHRLGGIAATCTKDGKRLKVVVVRKGGELFDADCQFLAPGVDPSTVPGSLLEIAETGFKTMSKWYKGTLSATAFQHSTIAGCTSTIAQVEVPCFFYQAGDCSIVMQTFGRGKPEVWDDPVKIIDAQAQLPPYGGTSLAVHLDVTGEWIYLYYQSAGKETGGIIGCKVRLDGKVVVQPSSVVNGATLPLGLPFAVMGKDGTYHLYYTTEDSKQIGEALGMMYVTLASPATKTPQMESFDCTYGPEWWYALDSFKRPHKISEICAMYANEGPVIYASMGARTSNLNPKSKQGGFTYLQEAMNRSPLAMTTPTLQSAYIFIIMVDDTGAVSLMKWSSTRATNSANQIPLDTMKTAFAPSLVPAFPPAAGSSSSPIAPTPVPVAVPMPPNLYLLPDQPPDATSPNSRHVVPPTVYVLPDQPPDATSSNSRRAPVIVPPPPSVTAPDTSGSPQRSTGDGHAQSTSDSPPAPSTAPVMDPLDFLRLMREVVQQEFAKRDAQMGSTPVGGPMVHPLPAVISHAGGLDSSGRSAWAFKGCLEVPWKKPPHIHHGLTMHFVMASTQKLWQTVPATLTYFFLEGNDVQKSKVRRVVKQWEPYAAVSFQEATSAANSLIRIKFDRDDGSWSFVGRDCENVKANEPTMNLGWIDSRQQTVPDNERGVILHEFGHTLGLLHEHQSPARGGGVKLDEKNTILYYKDSKISGWDEATIREQILDVYNSNEVSNYSELDTDSIMHYPMPKELTGLPKDVGYNSQLSQLDKAYMFINYPRAKPHPDAPNWTLETALQEAGVPADVQEEILDIPHEDGLPNVSEIRRVFSDWVKKSRIAKNSPSSKARATGQHRFLGKGKPEPQEPHFVLQPLDEDGDDCANDEMPVTRQAKKGVAHAVAAAASTLWPLADGDPDFELSLPFKWAEQSEDDRSPYRQALVKSAREAWEGHASLRFEFDEQAEQVIIGFQDNESPVYDSKWLSYTFGHGTKVKPKSCDRPDIIVSHSVCLRVCRNRDTADDLNVRIAKPTSKNKTKAEERNLRSAIHELGHVLGLVHEADGLLASLVESVPYGYEKAKTSVIEYKDIKDLVSTKYDFSSVMNICGMDQKELVSEELLSRYSFDKTLEFEDGWLFEGVQVKVWYELSPYDQANIALLYPGKRLLSPLESDAKAAPYELERSTTGDSLIRTYGSRLGLTTKTIEALEDHARNARWTKLRDIYIEAIRESMKEAWTDNIKELQKLVLDKEKMKKAKAAEEAAERKAAQKKAEAAQKKAGAERKKAEAERKKAEEAEAWEETDRAEKKTKLHDRPVRQRAVDPEEKSPPPKPFKDLLYETLDSIFGSTGNQYLSLQLPTRYLDKSSFAYKTSGIYSNFTKPTVVNEAEFRLTDELFDVAKVVSGPNGKSMAIVYEQALNNLVPKYQKDDLREQRELIRAWLLTKVDGEYMGEIPSTGDQSTSTSGRGKVYGMQEFAQLIDPDDPSSVDESLAVNAPNKAAKSSMAATSTGAGPMQGLPSSGQTSSKMTRIEYSQALMLEYLKERMDWELTRDKMVRKAMESGDTMKMEQVTRLLAHITAVHENRLAAKYGDVVVRGRIHTVREFLGYLDVKSTAEALQAAKDSLRESAMSSVYSSRVIYPVLMQPVDWFEALDTSFAPTDLSQGVDILRMQLTQKNARLDSLNDQLSAYMFATEGNVETLKQDVERLTNTRDDAQAKLTRQYTASTINAAKMYLTAVAPGSGALIAIAEDKNPTEDARSLLDPLKVDLKQISEDLNKVSEANKSLTSAGRALTDKMSQLEKARATDTRAQQAVLQRQITKCRSEIEDLYDRLEVAQLAAARHASDGTKSLNDVKMPVASDARWMDISFTTSVANKETVRDTSSTSSTSSWNVNLWLGSASGDSTSSEAKATHSTKDEHVDVEISLRVSLVTVDRSGWFQPQFFDMSNSFMRASENVRWSEWRGVKTAAELIRRVKDTGAFDAGESLFPAFPVGYLIAKDILVKISSNKDDDASSAKALSEKASASGGVLCFSFSHASHSEGDSSSVSTQTMSNGLVVKVPGPQILGYMMQVTPRDATSEYKPADTNYFLPDLSLDATSSNSRPAHSVVPPPPSVTRPNTSGSTQRSTGNGHAQSTSASHAQPTANGDAHPEQNAPRRAAGMMDHPSLGEGIADGIRSILDQDPETLKLVVDMAQVLKKSLS